MLSQIKNILEGKSDMSEKFISIQKPILESRKSTQEILNFRFTRLARQNLKLIESKQELNNQLIHLQNQFKTVVGKLDLE